MIPEKLLLLLVGVLAQQAPLTPQAPRTPAANVITVPSIVVVVTTQTSLTTVRVRPTPAPPGLERPDAAPPGLEQPSPTVPMMPLEPTPEATPQLPQPEPEQQLPCPLDPLLRRMLVSGNYSSAFRIANPSGADDEKSINAVCEANAFCAQRPAGLYCYRPLNTTTSMTGMAGAPSGGDDCLPVAMILCPEAIFIGCAEGYACHQVPDVWPWDYPPSQRLPLSGPSHQSQTAISGFFQAQPSMTLPQPEGMNVTQTQPDMQSTSNFSSIAHCMAVIRDESAISKFAEQAMMPLTAQDWNQWCSYRNQLKASSAEDAQSNVSVTVGSDCVTRTLSGVKIEAGLGGYQKTATDEDAGTGTISTVWWWPGMETGAAPFIAQSTTSSASTSVDPCIPSPPPTCNGPYPYAPVRTSTYLFISVSTTSVPHTSTMMQESVSTVTAMASTVTTSIYTTDFQTVTSIQTVSATAFQTVTAAITATPAPALPVAPVAPEPVATPQPGPATESEVSEASAAPGSIPQQLFPSAGEAYKIYTAKIGAIATIQ